MSDNIKFICIRCKITPKYFHQRFIFLPVFKAWANNLYIFRQCTHIAYLHTITYIIIKRRYCDLTIFEIISTNAIGCISDLRKVGGLSRVHRFPPPKNWPPRYYWNNVENGVKHHNPYPMQLVSITNTAVRIMLGWDGPMNRIIILQ